MVPLCCWCRRMTMGMIWPELKRPTTGAATEDMAAMEVASEAIRTEDTVAVSEAVSEEATEADSVDTEDTADSADTVDIITTDTTTDKRWFPDRPTKLSYLTVILCTHLRPYMKHFGNSEMNFNGRRFTTIANFPP
uniref:Uncharacterized protein n=1 Tax=Anopheles atroparvus TaxID=41427 RepID=A0AAG5D3E1_ANOAO